MVKIAYCSDLHLDCQKDLPDLTNKDKAEILIIAGDISELNHYKYFSNYFLKLSKQYKKILFVEGNHEWYRGNLHDIDAGIKQVMPDNFVLLRNDEYIYKDISFFGGTMWASLDNMDDIEKQVLLPHLISCFSAIKDGGRNFSADKCIELYNKYVDELMTWEITSSSKHKICISHFAPSLKSVTPSYASSKLNPYFCNNLDDFIETSSIDYFIHGHVHSKHDYKIGNTRILCNPRGYHNGEDVGFVLKYFEV